MCVRLHNCRSVQCSLKHLHRTCFLFKIKRYYLFSFISVTIEKMKTNIILNIYLFILVLSLFVELDFWCKTKNKNRLYRFRGLPYTTSAKCLDFILKNIIYILISLDLLCHPCYKWLKSFIKDLIKYFSC